jgi:DNA-binding NarL/FixJ family response regulator
MSRILIADDREIVRTTLRQIIPQADGSWEICGEAVDGKDAINKAIELSPDLIILDVAMPELDGITAARQIRVRLPDVPILIYSFLDVPHLELAAKQAGAQSVVPKGDRRALITEIRKALETKPAAAAPELSVASAASAGPVTSFPSSAEGPVKAAELEPPGIQGADTGGAPPDVLPSTDGGDPTS